MLNRFYTIQQVSPTIIISMLINQRAILTRCSIYTRTNQATKYLHQHPLQALYNPNDKRERKMLKILPHNVPNKKTAITGINRTTFRFSFCRGHEQGPRGDGSSFGQSTRTGRRTDSMGQNSRGRKHHVHDQGKYTAKSYIYIYTLTRARLILPALDK